MATIQCPNCQCHIQKPTNVVAWAVGIIALLMVGGFMFIIVCLAAIAAVGEADMDTQQHAYSQEWQSKLQIPIDRE